MYKRKYKKKDIKNKIYLIIKPNDLKFKSNKKILNLFDNKCSSVKLIGINEIYKVVCGSK